RTSGRRVCGTTAGSCRVSRCCDGREVTTAEEVAFDGETASLIVGQAQSPRTVRRAENAVLLEQVVDDRLLVSIYPAGEQQEAEGERALQPVHDRSVPERRLLFNGCEIGQPAPSSRVGIREANASSDAVDARRFSDRSAVRTSFRTPRGQVRLTCPTTESQHRPGRWPR